MLRRAFSWSIVGQVGFLLVGFVSSVAVARWLGPTDRGLLAVITYCVEVVVAVGGLGLTYAVIYFVSLPNPRAGAVLGNCLLVAAVLAAVSVSATVAGRHELARFFGKSSATGVWVLASVVVPVLFLDWCVRNQLYGKLRFDLLNMFLIYSKVVGLVVIVLLVGIFDFGVTGAMLSMLAISLFMIVATVWTLRGQLVPSVDLSLLGTMLAYGLRVSVGWVFQLVNFRIDVILVQQLTNLASVGYYVVAQSVAELALVFSSALQGSVTTLTAREETVAAKDDVTVSSMRHGVILTGVSVLALCVAGPLVIHFAFGTRYDKGIVPMLILLPGMIALGVGQIASGVLRGLGNPGVTSAVSAATVVVTLTLDFALIPRYEIVGAAIASLVAYTVFGVLLVGMMSRRTGISARSLLVPTGVEYEAYRSAAKRAIGLVTRA